MNHWNVKDCFQVLLVNNILNKLSYNLMKILEMTYSSLEGVRYIPIWNDLLTI